MAKPINDIAWGYRAIGRVIGRSTPTTRKLIHAGLLPVRMVDGQPCGSSAVLREYLVGGMS